MITDAEIVEKYGRKLKKWKNNCTLEIEINLFKDSPENKVDCFILKTKMHLSDIIQRISKEDR